MKIGRLGRSAFLVSMLATFSITIGLALANAPTGLLMIFFAVNFVWMLLVYIGRLHDVGHSGWWTLLAMWTSILGIIALAVWKGTKDKNDYGEVPPSSISHLLYFWRAPKVA